jgi:hypothetical protein
MQSRAQAKAKCVRRSAHRVLQTGGLTTVHLAGETVTWGKRADGRTLSPTVTTGEVIPTVADGTVERYCPVTTAIFLHFPHWKTVKASGPGKARIRDILATVQTLMGFDAGILSNPTNPDRLRAGLWRLCPRGDKLQELLKLQAVNCDLFTISATMP